MRPERLPLATARHWRAATLAFAATLLSAAPASAATLETWTLRSKHVDPQTVQFNGPADRPKALRVNVLKPDGYDGRTRFPVLYLLHGHGDAYDSWALPDKGDVRRIAAGLNAIVVMPEGARGWYADWWNGGRRGAPAWKRFYLEELVPTVERRLAIRKGRRWRAIAGLSMGGGGATLLAAERPGYFGSAATFSGAISIQRPEWPTAFDTQGERHVDVYGDPEDQRFWWTAHNPTALAPNLRHTRTFVATGDGTPTRPEELSNTFGALAEAELNRHAEDFVAALRGAGADVTYRPQPGIHDWPYWRAHLRQAIEWGLFRRVPERPAAWTYATASRSSEAWGLRFSFVTPPTAVATFRRDGNRLRATGTGTVRVRAKGMRSFTAKLPFERVLRFGRRR